MKKTFYWIITLLFPLLLLGLVELLLRAGGYQKEAQDLFIEVPNQPDYLMTNSDFVSRYFPTFRPQVAVSPFLKEKRKNSFRVFVLGGSSTQGFPYNFYYSFAEQLEQKLILNTLGLKVEVINLGMTAVNSYVIRDLSKRLMEYEPDAILIYAGHNEYYGSFGAGTTQFGMINNITLKRMVLSLKNLRLYQLLENLFKAPASGEQKKRTMMASVIKESEIALEGEIYEAGIEQYEQNIGDVIELFSGEGVPVYMGTVASNLKDQPPLSDDKTALEKFEEGQQLFDNGNRKDSYEKFVEAKELDVIRFRAPERINEIVRDLANQPNVGLVDVEGLLRQNSKSGIEDGSLFIDHLHPNFTGHKLIAEEFFKFLRDLDKVEQHYKPGIFNVPEYPSSFETSFAEITISRLLMGFPFQKGLTEAEEAIRFNQFYDRFIQRSFIDSIAAVTKVKGKSVPDALNNIIKQKKGEGDSLQVMSHYYELLKWQLNATNFIEKAIEYGVNNSEVKTYLVNIIEQVLNEGAYDPRYMNVLSSIYMDHVALERAKFWLDESLRLKSREPVLFYNLTRYYLVTKDSAKASQYYRMFMQAQQQ